MSHEIVTILIWIGAISLGLTLLWLALNLALALKEDNPAPMDVFFLGVGMTVLWPLTLVGFVVYGWFTLLRGGYRRQKRLTRKIRAVYWEYRAKKEEDVAPERTTRKVS